MGPMTGFPAWLDAREPALRRAVHALTGDADRTRILVREAAVAASTERTHRRSRGSRRSPGPRWRRDSPRPGPTATNP